MSGASDKLDKIATVFNQKAIDIISHRQLSQLSQLDQDVISNCISWSCAQVEAPWRPCPDTTPTRLLSECSSVNWRVHIIGLGALVLIVLTICDGSDQSSHAGAGCGSGGEQGPP